MSPLINTASLFNYYRDSKSPKTGLPLLVKFESFSYQQLTKRHLQKFEDNILNLN